MKGQKMENNDKSKWINTVLSELSSVGNDIVTQIVENCGENA